MEDSQKKAKKLKEKGKRASRPGLFLRRSGHCGLGWCQGELGGFPQHSLLLLRERAPKLIGLEHPLALLRRHCAQIAYGGLHHLPPLCRQLLPLRSQLSGLLLLLRRKVLPGLDPVQSALLFLSRQAVEVLQPVY